MSPHPHHPPVLARWIEVEDDLVEDLDHPSAFRAVVAEDLERSLAFEAEAAGFTLGPVRLHRHPERFTAEVPATDWVLVLGEAEVLHAFDPLGDQIARAMTRAPLARLAPILAVFAAEVLAVSIALALVVSCATTPYSPEPDVPRTPYQETRP